MTAEAVISLAAGKAVDWLPDALRHCNGADLIRLAMCLGMFRTGWRGERRIETLVAKGSNVVAGVAVSGIETLREWPFPLHGYLVDEQARAGSRRGRFGVQKTLGPFYEWMRDLPLGPVRDAVLEVARTVVHSDPILAHRSHRSPLLGDKVESSPVVGIMEASELLGVSHASVKRLQAEGSLPAGASDGRGVPMAIPRQAVEALAARTATMLTLQEVAKLLQISKQRVRLLVQRGLLVPVSRAQEDGRAAWSFGSDAIAEWISRLEAGAAPDCYEKAASCDTAARMLLRQGAGFDELVAAVCDGSLPIIRLDPAKTGLKRWVFRLADVQRVCAARVLGPMVSVQEAARRLKVKWQVAAHLAHRGLLLMQDDKVLASSIERFAADCISGADLAKGWGTSPKALAGRLEAAGVRPVSGPLVDGGRQNSYRRADLVS